MVTIEDLVPQKHFVRKLETGLDLSFVYEETCHLYSRRYGRPPIDPVVLVKYLLVGYLYGIPSERQIERRIQTDMALRWYLGLDLLRPAAALCRQDGGRGRLLLRRAAGPLLLPRRKRTAGQGPVPQRQRRVLGVLGGPDGLPELSPAGEVLE